MRSFIIRSTRAWHIVTVCERSLPWTRLHFFLNTWIAILFLMFTLKISSLFFIQWSAGDDSPSEEGGSDRGAVTLDSWKALFTFFLAWLAKNLVTCATTAFCVASFLGTAHIVFGLGAFWIIADSKTTMTSLTSTIDLGTSLVDRLSAVETNVRL